MPRARFICTRTLKSIRVSTVLALPTVTFSEDGCERSALGARLVGGELGAQRREELACAHNRTGSLRIGCILTLEQVGLPEAAHRISAATAAWRGQP